MSTPLISIQIIDDEPSSCNLLQVLLNEIPNVSISKVSYSSYEGLNAAVITPPDLLFLDMAMPEMDGIKLMKKINSLNNKMKIVAVSGSKDYAIKAIQESVFDYLLKPFDKNELIRVINKYNQFKKEQEEIDSSTSPKINESKFIFRTHNGLDIINIPDIVFVEADKNYSSFFLHSENRKICCYNIGKVEKLLPKSSFKRISRKHIINLNRLDSVDTKKKVCNLRSQNELVSINYSITLKDVMELLNMCFTVTSFI